jgi:soluble lytic murein transglycosylase-like protein
MKRENYYNSLKTFAPVGYDQDLIDKSLIFDIDDNYNYGDDYLKKVIADKLNNYKL